MNKIFIAGGCGFIGSNLTKFLLNKYPNCKITIFDSLITGKLSFLSDNLSDDRLKIIVEDLRNFDILVNNMDGSDLVIHLAANADIAAAVLNPAIDFNNGTFLTHNILEAMRINNVKKIIYSSGSGVYGDLGKQLIYEDTGSFMPISTYGASKLASESLISSYSYMFNIKSIIFRFANVVGKYQTHGVGYDFVQKLNSNNKELLILGDGNQLKPYIHVRDVVNAIDISISYVFRDNLNTFNLSNFDFISVNEIARIVFDIMNLENVTIKYSGGSRGWKGDVPYYNLDSSKIRNTLGWTHTMSSKEAIISSIKEIIS
jgi:UDP-glucose 4-epimerase